MPGLAAGMIQNQSKNMADCATRSKVLKRKRTMPLFFATLLPMQPPGADTASSWSQSTASWPSASQRCEADKCPGRILMQVPPDVRLPTAPCTLLLLADPGTSHVDILPV